MPSAANACGAPAVAAALTAPVPGAWGGMQHYNCGYPLPPHLDHPAPQHAIRTFALCPQDRRSSPEASLCSTMPGPLDSPAASGRFLFSRHGQTSMSVLGASAAPAPVSLAGRLDRGDFAYLSTAVCGSSLDHIRPSPRGCLLGRQGAGRLRQLKFPPSGGATTFGLGQRWGPRRRPPHSML